MKNKQIIILVVIIFLAFVGYKLISAKIQENKEKAVLQEKARLDELTKEPLNKCIDDIDKQSVFDIKSMKDSARLQNSEPFLSDCMTPTGHGITLDARVASGEVNLRDYCTFTIGEQMTEEENIINKAKLDKEDCYKRYK